MAPILQVQNLHHIYSAGTPFEHIALNDVSFTVERGEFIGVIGHTGSGKSTLMQHLNGLPGQSKFICIVCIVLENVKSVLNAHTSEAVEQTTECLTN